MSVFQDIEQLGNRFDSGDDDDGSAAPASGGGAVDCPPRRDAYPCILFRIHANEWIMTTNQYGHVSEPLHTTTSPTGVSNERASHLMAAMPVID